MNAFSLAKFFSVGIVLYVFAFLINNYLTFAGDWPGAFSITNDLNIYSIFQFSLYLIAILFPIYIVFLYKQNFTIIQVNEIKPKFSEKLNEKYKTDYFISVNTIKVLLRSYMRDNNLPQPSAQGGKRRKRSTKRKTKKTKKTKKSKPSKRIRKRH